MAAAATLALASAGHAQGFELISISSTGTASNGENVLGNASADGRYIAFNSAATNLVAGDTNGASQDVFVRDRLLQTTELVSRWSNGSQGQWAGSGTVSDDGRYVAFSAFGMPDFGSVYRRDRATPTTKGLTSNNMGFWGYVISSISGDGNFIAYYSENNSLSLVSVGVFSLVPGVPNWSGSSGMWGSIELRLGPLSRDGRYIPYGFRFVPGAGSASTMVVADRTAPGQYNNFSAPNPLVVLDPRAISSDGRYLVYWQDSSPASLRVRDMQTGLDERVDVALGGAPSPGAPSASISDDGRWVAFVSPSAALVVGDTNGVSDAFLRDRLLQRTVRISVGASGEQLSQATSRVWLAPGGGCVLLETKAQLLPADTNSSKDIYFMAQLPEYFDADLDSFGGALAQWRPMPVSSVAAGRSLTGGDCDDTDPARNPAAVEVCNGLDDDCDGQTDEGFVGQRYCITTVTPNSCVPQITGSGCPAVSAPSGFSLVAHGLEGQRSGMIAYSSGSQQIPFSPGNPSTLCLLPPTQRTTLQSSGGTSGQCDGSFSLDFLAWVASHPGALHVPLVAGTTLHFQAYVREPAYPDGACLTDGWRVTLGP